MLSLLPGLTLLSALAPAHYETLRGDEPLPVVRRVELAIRVDYFDEVVRATSYLTLQAPADAEVARVPLLLYRLFEVEHVEVVGSAGAAVAFDAKHESMKDWPQFVVTQVWLTLDEPIPAGEERTLSIRYGGKLAGYTETGMRYLRDSITERFTILRSDLLAFPEVGRASDGPLASATTFDYELHVTVPENFVVANGGRRTKRVVADGEVTYSYRNLEPSDRIDIAIAEYLEIENDRVRIYCFPEHEEGARRILVTMKRVMDLYTGWFGPLVGDRAMSVIELPTGMGAQADVTTILQPEPAFVSADNSALFYHEVSHLWNLRPLDPKPCRVESEGLAMFLQDLTRQVLDGDEGALDRGWDRARESFLAACERSPELATMRMADFGKHGMTGAAYTKGAMYFRVLYELVGHDDFLNIIRHLYAEHATTGATLSRWARTAQGGTHTDIIHSYDDWLFGDHSTEFIRRGKTPREIADHYVD